MANIKNIKDMKDMSKIDSQIEVKFSVWAILDNFSIYFDVGYNFWGEASVWDWWWMIYSSNAEITVTWSEDFPRKIHKKEKKNK